jgi:hypothetical protein
VKEEDPLDRERGSEHLAERAGELRPEQAELEGEDRARDRADGEGHGRHLRPPLCQLERDRVLAS